MFFQFCTAVRYNTLGSGYLMYCGYYDHTLNLSSGSSLISQEFSKQLVLLLALFSKIREEPT